MRILWFNWRDTKNPAAGGAEVYTQQIGQRLISKGHQVTLFTSRFPGSLEEECLEGVRIVRAGGRVTVYSKAKKYYKNYFSGEKYDIVIDEINTKPFFTAKFVDKGETIFALIHQLTREFWFSETPFPLNLIGYHILENRWLRQYLEIPTITVSNSTRKDLEDMGFKRIYLVQNGVNVEPVKEIPQKSEQPTILYLGRMTVAKKPEDAIQAFNLVRENIRDADLWMVGDGYLRRELQSKHQDVKFFGYVNQKTKEELMKKAWLIVVPGTREGWGQIVTDANALGTPAVGYRIPGLRDSIQDGYNGLLVRRNPEALAEGMIKLIRDQNLRRNLIKNGMNWAKQFSWEESTQRFLNLVEGGLDKNS